MSLLHPGILFGLALVAAPVIVHLLMRQKPRKLVFPAMQLIQQRRKQNSRRLRLRHLWLLLLRIAAIGLLVFAIARPSLPAANYALSVREVLTLLGVVAVAIAVYAAVLHRWRRALPRYEYVAKRAVLRGWTTGATLLALLLAVGWPYQRRVSAEITAPPPDARIDVPVAAVFVFDTSLSMGYLQEGRTRLDLARQIAGEHLRTLPAGSRVAIADVANDNPIVFQSTHSSAQARINDLALHAVRLPLNDRVRAALLVQEDDRRQQLQEQSSTPAESRRDRYVRRVYIFTDLARSAWRTSGSQLVRQELERLPNVQLFVVDVGELQPQNVAVTDVVPSRHRISKGGGLVVAATIESIGVPPEERDVELMLVDGAGEQVGPMRRSVVLESGAPQRIEFDLVHSLAGPIVQGEVRLVSSDPLVFDDVRYVTVEVGPPPRVLVVAPTRAQAAFWMATLNPDEAVRFETAYAPPERLGELELSQFDVLCLINVPQPSDAQWRRLSRYVDEGGGLAVFLGSTDERMAVDYNRGQPQALLPARLEAWTAKGDWRLSLDALNHPLFRKVREHADRGAVSILENELQVYRFWKVRPTEDAAVLATYTDPERSPALVAKTHGRGRIVLFTTAVDAKHFTREWNTLTKLVNSWAWLALAHPMVEHLGRLSDLVYTIEAGEPVTIPVSSSDPLLLRRPNLTQTSRTPPPGAGRMVIDDAALVGHYSLSRSGSGAPVAGFSVNPPAGESDFTRLERTELDELLGTGRYQMARTVDELQAEVNVADLGKEVFSLVMLLVIVAFCGEHLVANRFYEAGSDDAEEGVTAAAGAAVRFGQPASTSVG